VGFTVYREKSSNSSSKTRLGNDRIYGVEQATADIEEEEKRKILSNVDFVIGK